jgi:hypothetical protein
MEILNIKEDKIILVCAVGRTGSTTLQLILNTIPNSNICGENNGAINHLLEFYREMKYTHHKFNNEFSNLNNENKKNIFKIFQNRIKPAWFNTFDFEKIKQHIRNTIISMFKNDYATDVWGFKEIRYEGKLGLLKEFRELFPQTKVILNIREDIRKQSNSAWFKNDPVAFQKIKNQTNEMISFYKENQSFCFLNTLEKMYSKQHLIDLFCFVGCSQYFHEDKIKKILIGTKES